MTTRFELTDFARNAIPDLVATNGGTMNKQKLYAQVESDFGPLSRGLRSRMANGSPVRKNAIAHALRLLVRDGVLERSSSDDKVRLKPKVRTYLHPLPPLKIGRPKTDDPPSFRS